LCLLQARASVQKSIEDPAVMGHGENGHGLLRLAGLAKNSYRSSDSDFDCLAEATRLRCLSVLRDSKIPPFQVRLLNRRFLDKMTRSNLYTHERDHKMLVSRNLKKDVGIAVLYMNVEKYPHTSPLGKSIPLLWLKTSTYVCASDKLYLYKYISIFMTNLLHYISFVPNCRLIFVNVIMHLKYILYRSV
jgi:hypothetical protein